MSRSEKVCKQIIEYLVSHRYTNQVHQRIVTEAIIFVRGPDTRTIKNWTRCLITLGFLNRSSGNPQVFDIDLTKYPEMLTKALHGESQKRLL